MIRQFWSHAIRWMVPFLALIWSFGAYAGGKPILLDLIIHNTGVENEVQFQDLAHPEHHSGSRFGFIHIENVSATLEQLGSDTVRLTLIQPMRIGLKSVHSELPRTPYVLRHFDLKIDSRTATVLASLSVAQSHAVFSFDRESLATKVEALKKQIAQAGDEFFTVGRSVKFDPLYVFRSFKIRMSLKDLWQPEPFKPDSFSLQYGIVVNTQGQLDPHLEAMSQLPTEAFIGTDPLVHEYLQSFEKAWSVVMAARPRPLERAPEKREGNVIPFPIKKRCSQELE